MPTTLKSAVAKYLFAGNPARGTRDEYQTTLRKWKRWGGGVPIEDLGARKSASSWIGSTSARSLTKARIPAEPRTRLGNTCVPLLRGHGNRISSSHHRVSLSPGRSGQRGRPTLSDQGGDQRPLLRDSQDGTSTRLGSSHADWALLAERDCPCSSTTALIPGPCGNPLHSTNRSCGGMCLGAGNRQTGKLRNCHPGGGSSTAG